MKRLLIILLLIIVAVPQSNAVLKEQNLEQTLSVLRQELVKRYNDLTGQAQERQLRNRSVMNELMETMKRSNQNSLMLYSQNSNYVFDLTYACHEATEQYQQFQRQQLPFRVFLQSHEIEIARFDSLIVSLRQMPVSMMGQQARIDRSVSLTLAVSIRNYLESNRSLLRDERTTHEVHE